MLTTLAHRVILVWGWRRYALAFTAGAVTTLGFAPFHAWPLLFATFTVLVWLIDGAAAGRYGRVFSAAVAGWWFGFGFFVTGLYWTGIALTVDAKTFAWLIPFAVAGLPAGLALLTALGAALAATLWSPGASRVLALAAAMTVAEWLRGHLLTGFPWNAYGYALTAPLPLAQSASVLGLWGLTFVAVAIFASPAALADEAADTRRPWLPLTLAGVVLIAMAGFGVARLATHASAFVDGVKLRIMQPNLSQDTKFNYAAKAQVMRHYLTLSDRATGPATRGVRDVTHLIWPESAFPFLLSREPEALAQIADLLPPATVLITGAARTEPPSPADKRPRAYNSIYVIDDAGSMLAVYDKVHLVPFGEYLPFQNLLERIGLTQITKVRGGFSSGGRRRAMSVPSVPPMLPLICYEIIFPRDAVPAGERPGWMLNLTNDGWFGNSSGPYQHFQQARVRAIEEGLPLVRAANTGISAVVDPLGRIVDSLPLGTEGILDARLPQPLDVTLYARWGDIFAGILVALSLLVCLRRRWRPA